MRAAVMVDREFIEKFPPRLRGDYDDKDIPVPFKTGKIMLGRLLGIGEFSHVYKGSKFRPEDDDNNVLRSSGLSGGKILARRAMRSRKRYHGTNLTSYALEQLRPNLPEKYGREEYAQAARDLVLKAIILNLLRNLNIINLRGALSAGPGGFTWGV